MHFYAEETHPHLRETRQADRWLKEVRPEDTTPMIRLQKSDYYIFEPAMLDDQSVCVPHRWFTRDGKFLAKAWILEQTLSDDNIPGWVVRQDREVEVHEGQFFKNFPELGQCFRLYGVPDPANIYGKLPWKVNRHYPYLQ